MDGSNVEYAIFDQKVSDVPTPGLDDNVTLSYTNDLHLTSGDFKTVTSNELYQILSSHAQSSTFIMVYGYMYNDDGKYGIHDIHQNSGETNWVRWKGQSQDGLIGFYFPGHIQWIPIKFQSQYLPNNMN
jgi:uncharacterized protein YukJ